jgi:hypothetical protein
LFKQPCWSSHAIFSWTGILLPPAIYFYLIFSYSLNLPFADDFVNLDELINIFQSKNLNEQFSIFFSLRNGHRIVFVKLIYTLTYALLGEIDFRVLIAIGNISLLALFYLFFKIFKVPHTNLLYFVPVSILLFQLQFWQNMVWAASSLQHQFILLFTGLTFYFLSKNSTSGFYGSFFFAVVSVLTHGGGVVTIFLSWIMLLLQKRYQQSSIWAIGTLLLGFFYFKNFQAGTNMFVGVQSLAGFKNMLMFYFSFLGSSLSPGKIYVAVGFGIILNFYLCFLIWDKYFKKNMMVFMFIAYIFLNAALVALARSDLGVGVAFASRYKVVSVVLIILVYMSLAERFSLVTGKFRNFVAIGILFALTSYSVFFKPGKFDLETKYNSLRWLTNQWVNTNHGFFFRHGTAGAEDSIPNSILLKAVEGGFYKFPYEILYIPDRGYSVSVTLPKTCETEKPDAFKAKFSTIPIGPESSPYLMRLEGMIHSPASDEIGNKAPIHLILKSKDGSYIFETHPQHYLHGSVFFENQPSNTGFIALIPFEKIEKGVYRIGFCYRDSIRFEDKFLSKTEEKFKKVF